MTGRWRPLPGCLEPEVAYLIGLLRELKDRSGLSLAALATRTAYSKSSWERYLNGTTLPPRQAVEAIGRLVGEPPDRLRALWERAETRWSGRAERARPTSTGPAPAPDTMRPDHDQPAGRSRARIWLSVTVAGCALAAAMVALLRPAGIIGGNGSVGSPASPVPVPVPVAVGCHRGQCEGKDAYALACDTDAASFADLRFGSAYVELRISDRCGAAWAQISHSAVGDQIQVWDRTGRSEMAVVPDDASTGRYVATLMIPAGRHSDIRACVRRPGGESRCTGWGADRRVAMPPPSGSRGP
jgi:transcriptional regulator with XRE-family HTH domain